MTCAVCVSYAFMLPVATAPNAIIFSASSLKTWEMMRAGFFMNILCILTTWGAVNTYGTSLYGLSEFPQWADPDHNTTCIDLASQANLSLSLPSPSLGL